jgi:GT2 family glycosyltransferase
MSHPSHGDRHPRVSLVIPNRDNARVLDLVLERLAVHTTYPDVEVVLVDDGSTDSSREILRRWRDSGRLPDFRLIEREHGGVVDALNAGLRAATGELVVQLDADAAIETPGWLERMVAFFESDRRIGVVTAKVVFPWGDVHACGVNVIGARGFHDRGTEVSEPVGRRTNHQRVSRPAEDDCAACRHIAEVDGGIGCCMMYRREVALAVGGYDAGFSPVWLDDVDLALSIRRHGRKVFFLPDVRVVHHLDIKSLQREVPLRGRAALSVLWRARKLVSPSVRSRARQALGLDRAPVEHSERLAHHYAYWRRKWGFDILNPDMSAVHDRWGDTEICWSTNREMREAGERIVAAYHAARTAAA